MNTYEELYHFGIKGMKWGVRRERDNLNPKYKSNQRLADRKMYSKGAVKRINKNMNEGLGLKAARSLEADRLNSYRKKARNNRYTGKKIGGLVGGILGGASGIIAVSALNHHMSKYTELNAIGKFVKDIASNPVFTLSFIGGAAGYGSYYGKQAGKAIGEKGTMRAGGYDPKKLRD